MAGGFEKLFPGDRLSKRERVERTLNHQPVDRVALHEQLSHNPRVIALYTGKKIDGFRYTLDDICAVIARTLDMCFPPVAPRGTERVTDEEGFVVQHDNWTSWRVSRPFGDEHGAAAWLRARIEKLRADERHPEQAAAAYRDEMLELQAKIGDTVILNYSHTGFCSVFDAMGLEIYTYFSYAYPEVLSEYLDLMIEREIERVHAVADRALSPAVLIPEDFATKQGPIFPPDFLKKYHYPGVERLAAAWHEHGIKVLYHSDGNYKKAIPELVACGVDGFYCLEPSCGMDVVELKNTWPEMVWAGGVDGVDLMERGTPEAVSAEVLRHIRETDALRTGGMFVASSSEINPPVKPENFRAMVEAAGELTNADFYVEDG